MKEEIIYSKNAYKKSREKKRRGKWQSFSQVTNIFPRLNFNLILFNPTRTFPTFL